MLSITAAEARRTWGGRFGHLRLTAAVLLVAGSGFCGYAGARLPALSWLDAACFWGLNGLLCWGGAWLGADLIPRGRGGEGLLARIAGRILPLYAVVLAGFAALSFGWHSGLTGWGAYLGMPHIPMDADASYPLGLVGLLPTAAFPLAVISALLGSLFQRPRRTAVAATAVIIGASFMPLPLGGALTAVTISIYVVAIRSASAVNRPCSPSIAAAAAIVGALLVVLLPSSVVMMIRGLMDHLQDQHWRQWVGTWLTPNLEPAFLSIFTVGGMLYGPTDQIWYRFALALTGVFVVTDLILCAILWAVARQMRRHQPES
ncbi:MAG: hypothetical protein ACK47B_11290 [Armatimonadota bacterium]